ncbi:MAG: hypothetical protein VB031_09540 [Eubacteriaceae bacterium]|nr:hypothetical protein [Eubacteriaceae bacterium]
MVRRNFGYILLRGDLMVVPTDNQEKHKDAAVREEMPVFCVRGWKQLAGRKHGRALKEWYAACFKIKAAEPALFLGENP